MNGAIKYIVNAANQHPNRLDVVKAKGGATSQPPAAEAFQRGTNPSREAAFGQTTLPQGPAPAFGQPSVPSGPASTFGRPSTTFGQPSAPGSTFGQPSTIGQGASTFGQLKNLGTTPVFGQQSMSSAMNPPQGNANPFGSAPGIQPGAFGKPSNPFGQQSAQPNNAFGTASGSSATDPSGQGLTTAPAFGQTTATLANPFSAPQASKSPTDSAPFGKPSVTQQMSATFGQNAPTSAHPTGFGQPANLAVSGTSSSTPYSGPHPATTAQRDGQGKRLTWKGQPVTYRDGEPFTKAGDGGWARIFYPDGPPVLNKTQELPNEMYDERTKDAYQYVMQHGTFKDGVIPELPPKREWCNWDF